MVDHTLAVIPLHPLLAKFLPLYLRAPLRLALAVVHCVGLLWLHLALDPVTLYKYFIGRYYFEYVQASTSPSTVACFCLGHLCVGCACSLGVGGWVGGRVRKCLRRCVPVLELWASVCTGGVASLPRACPPVVWVHLALPTSLCAYGQVH
jgi:hypothetical protein